jgi:hypothetical protein
MWNLSNLNKTWLLLLAFAAFNVPIAIAVTESVEAQNSTVQLRRLNEQQYRNSVADIFGADVDISGRFEPELRNGGLLALGSSVATVTPFGFEQFDVMARSIASQFVEKVRLNPKQYCARITKSAWSSKCTVALLRDYGRKVFRRPLTEKELNTYTEISQNSLVSETDAYAGLESSLAGMLISPAFLFRMDTVEPNPKKPEEYRLNGYARAQRLSYLLWNTTPDTELLDAAASGNLYTDKGINKQVDRLLASPRLQNGVRALFSDMLHFDEFDKLAKDAEVFPRFNFKTAEDAREETLRTIVDHLLLQQGDYRGLFTTRKTFLTPSLGLVYRVPVNTPDEWVPFTFSADVHPKAGQRAGLLTQISFLALHSHPGRSSATLRGMAVRELFLCQIVPTPPANVSFDVVQDTSNPLFKTARDRVMAHQTDPACAGCHRITDPIGLALEHFDGSGVYQATENGVAIDASGELDGQTYESAVGLGVAVANHPDTTSCLIRRAFESGTGRKIERSEKTEFELLNNNFAANGYKLPTLLKSLVTSSIFYAPQASPIQDADLAMLMIGRSQMMRDR